MRVSLPPAKPAPYLPSPRLFVLWLVPAFATMFLSAVIGKALLGSPPEWLRIGQGALWGGTMGGAFARRLQPDAAAVRYFLIMAGVNLALGFIAWALARQLG